MTGVGEMRRREFLGVLQNPCTRWIEQTTRAIALGIVIAVPALIPSSSQGAIEPGKMAAPPAAGEIRSTCAQPTAQLAQRAPAAQSPTVQAPVFQIPEGPFIAADAPLNAKQSAALKAFKEVMRTAISKPYASDSDTGFKALLEKRRAQIDAALRKYDSQIRAGQMSRGGAVRAELPHRPGHALFRARAPIREAINEIRAVFPDRARLAKELFNTDEFDALMKQYQELFTIMEEPPVWAQNSATPFEDVLALARTLALNYGTTPAFRYSTEEAERFALIELYVFFQETGGRQNVDNVRSNTYKGSWQLGKSEFENGERRAKPIMAAIQKTNPEVYARDQQEAARAASMPDKRYNHWLNVRNGIMNTHIDIGKQIVASVPDIASQAKVAQLIQLIPGPTKAALNAKTSVPFLDRTLNYTAQIKFFLDNNAINPRINGALAPVGSQIPYRNVLAAMQDSYENFIVRAIDKYKEIKSPIRHGRACPAIHALVRTKR
jgi:hypothetical protein